MPTVLHEASFDVVKDAIIKSIDALPYDRDIIFTTTNMNWPLKVKGASITADVIVSITAMDLPAKVVLVPFLAECALSEKDEHVFGKVEKVVLARPDIKCAVVVLVREDTDYAAPDDDSIASTVLRGGTSSDPRLLTQEDFLNLRTTPRSFSEPVVIGDHTWCHVTSVEYFVWVKGDDAPINVRSKDPAHTAYGTLVPTVDMDSVTNMLDKGLTKIKDSIVTLQQKLAPDLDFTVLAETPIQSFFDWSRASRRILTAAEITRLRPLL
ncbi:hypothetical protein DEU56DRAFT_906935 [Suillus clintonianus]|uniref:uncharacterized protein n=1 Tax=Suillus clintonianus TaxID=1904413 RepID=UPI001B874CE2|nr:uncharacterized protein DEU56DRAFT_906935 [Suillus clintonianus]KAG2154523.1 hypothetical protein DEU56DRAFT_906935 [Suillus clintonianus]